MYFCVGEGEGRGLGLSKYIFVYLSLYLGKLQHLEFKGNSCQKNTLNMTTGEISTASLSDRHWNVSMYMFKCSVYVGVCVCVYRCYCVRERGDVCMHFSFCLSVTIVLIKNNMMSREISE